MRCQTSLNFAWMTALSVTEVEVGILDAILDAFLMIFGLLYGVVDIFILFVC